MINYFITNTEGKVIIKIMDLITECKFNYFENINLIIKACF